MRVYLAASTKRRKEIIGYAGELSGVGMVVTSRWLNDTEPVWDQQPTNEVLSSLAVRDLTDIARADWFVIFTGGEKSAHGGRHFETGYAYRSDIPIIVCGPVDNVFQALPFGETGVVRCANWAETKARLMQEAGIVSAPDSVGREAARRAAIKISNGDGY